MWSRSSQRPPPRPQFLPPAPPTDQTLSESRIEQLINIDANKNNNCDVVNALKSRLNNKRNESGSDQGMEDYYNGGDLSSDSGVVDNENNNYGSQLQKKAMQVDQLMNQNEALSEEEEEDEEGEYEYEYYYESEEEGEEQEEEQEERAAENDEKEKPKDSLLQLLLPEVNKDEDSPLDGMLGRLQSVRDERKAILQNLQMMKAAFSAEDGIKDEEFDFEAMEKGQSDESKEDTPAADSPQKNPSIVKLERQDSDYVQCFICNFEFGKLSKGAVMHMGLSDGEPICPKALYLTQASREKIKSVADSSDMTVEQKYKVLNLSPLARQNQDYRTSHIITDVERFLGDIQDRVKQDQVELEKIKNEPSKLPKTDQKKEKRKRWWQQDNEQKGQEADNDKSLASSKSKEDRVQHLYEKIKSHANKVCSRKPNSLAEEAKKERESKQEVESKATPVQNVNNTKPKSDIRVPVQQIQKEVPPEANEKSSICTAKANHMEELKAQMERRRVLQERYEQEKALYEMSLRAAKAEEEAALQALKEEEERIRREEKMKRRHHHHRRKHQREQEQYEVDYTSNHVEDDPSSLVREEEERNHREDKESRRHRHHRRRLREQEQYDIDNTGTQYEEDTEPLAVQEEMYEEENSHREDKESRRHHHHRRRHQREQGKYNMGDMSNQVENDPTYFAQEEEQRSLREDKESRRHRHHRRKNQREQEQYEMDITGTQNEQESASQAGQEEIDEEERSQKEDKESRRHRRHHRRHHDRSEKSHHHKRHRSHHRNKSSHRSQRERSPSDFSELVYEERHYEKEYVSLKIIFLSSYFKLLNNVT